MIRVPVDTGDGGGEELYPTASYTYHVEWSDRDPSDGRLLPRDQAVARFVTPFGTASRLIRLRLADVPPA
ncbi:hypothetical protein K8I85_15210 [bacterium]|nr:hypothetical protein [bacterium]